MAEELLGKLNEMYSLLTGTLSSEEEEQKRDELEKLIEEIINKSGENAQMKTDAENLNKIVKSWDPIDKWFKEVDGLSSGIKKFLDTYQKPKEVKVEKTQAPSLDANSIALLKAAGIDVEKLQAAGVSIDVEKLKAVLLSQITTQPAASQTTNQASPIVQIKEKEGLTEEKKTEETEEQNEEDKDAEEERKKKLEALLKGQTSPEQAKTEQKKKLLAPKIEIPPIGGRKEIKEEEKTEEDKVVVNKQSAKIKIKVKTPTLIQTETQQEEEPYEQPEEPQASPIVQPTVIKPVVGPKIAVVSNGANLNQANSAQTPNNAQVGVVQKPNNTPVAEIEQSNIAPVAAVQKPNITPVGAVQKPNIAPIGAVQKPNIAPVGAVQKPNIAPVGAVQKPNIAPVGETQKTNIQPIGGANPATISPIKAVAKVDMKEKVDFKVQKTAEEEESIYTDMSKESLLKELIYLQNRQYFFEKTKKVMAEKHKNGKISDADYRGELEKLKFESDRVAKSLNEVRNRIMA